MKRWRWWAIAVGAFVVLIVVGAVATNLNPPKSFSLPRVVVDATLEGDGSLHVVEHITYDFTGSFSYGTRPIPVGSYEIRDVTVSEQGRLLTSVGAPHNLQWFFSATDEERTFDIAYTVVGAVAAGPDVAELYWKWVGDDHPPIGRVRSTLAVPPGPGELRAWGHGPLNGVVVVGGSTVRWRADDLPQGAYFEGRVAIPKARLPNIPVTTAARLPTILAEERAWAESANEQRERAREEAERDQRTRDALRIVVPIATLAAMLGFFFIWRRWGREPAKPDDIGEYMRDLPDDPPAVVDSLLHWGAVRPVAFSATTIDLAQRGHLKITEVREDRALLPDRVERSFSAIDVPDPLRDFELTALAQVFASGDDVSQDEMVKFAREHQSASAERWKRFQSEVGSDLRGRKYIRGGRAGPFLANIGMVIVVALLGVAALAYRAWIPGVIALAWAAVQLAATPVLRQRTPDGNRRYHEWLGVQRYLRDFSNLEEAPAGHLVLWERYLVYAVALGVSAELARGLVLRVPEVANDPHFTAWFVGSHGVSSFGSLGSFGASFGGAVATASTPPSSSGGGGGGFSGGGGGGGGGGGIGAG